MSGPREAGLPKLLVAPVTIVAVHDGDSVHVAAPFHVIWPELRTAPVFPIRVAHVNAAELNKAGGREAPIHHHAPGLVAGVHSKTVIGRSRDKMTGWLIPRRSRRSPAPA